MKKGIIVFFLMIFLIGCVQREVIYKACEIADCERGKVENLITGAAVGVPDSKPEVEEVELVVEEKQEVEVAEEEEVEEEVEEKEDFLELKEQDGDNIKNVEIEKSCPEGYDGIRVKYYVADLAKYVDIKVDDGSGYQPLVRRPNRREDFEDMIICHKGKRRCSWLLDEGYTMIEGNKEYKLRVDFVFEGIPDVFGDVETWTEHSEEFYLDLRKDSSDYYLRGFCN